MAQFGNNGIDSAIVAVIYVDPDTPQIKVSNPSMGRFSVQVTLMPGGAWILPAVGEQWLIRKIGHAWYLDARVAFQDPRMNLRDEEGTTGIGSSGPTYIIGSKVYVGNDHQDLLEIIADLTARIEELESGQ